MIRQKLCGNCVFPQYFQTRKLGEITTFYAMTSDKKLNTVDSLIRGYHRGNDFCPLIGVICLLGSLIFLTLCGLGRGTLKVLTF